MTFCNMVKRVFWHAVNDGNNTPCSPCPFVGVTVNSFDEFIKDVLQGRIFHRNGKFDENGNALGRYPSVSFSLTKGRRLYFAGWNRHFPDSPIMDNGKHSKWMLYDENLDCVMMYIDIRNEEHRKRIWNMFEDDAKVQAQIDLMSAMVKKNGGLTIHVG